MPYTCFLCKELSQSNSEISFHRIPSDPAIRKSWLSVCGTVESGHVSRIRICSKHFNADDFSHPNWSTRKTLKKEAVPLKYDRDPVPWQSEINTPAGAAIFGHTPVCFVCGKSSDPNLNNRISFHRVPTDPFTRKTWFTFCGLSERDDVSNIRICSRHFKPNDFCNLNAPIRRKLIKSAVPSIVVPRNTTVPFQAQTITAAGTISEQVIHRPKRQKLGTVLLIPVTICTCVMDNIVEMDVNRRKCGAHTQLLASTATASTSVLSDQNIERQSKLEHVDNLNPPDSTVATSTFPYALDNFVDMDELKPLENLGISSSDSVDPLLNLADMNTSTSTDPLDNVDDMNEEKPLIYPEVPPLSSADFSDYFLGIKELNFHNYAKDIRTLVSSVASSSNSVIEEIEHMKTSILCTEHERMQIKGTEGECNHLEASPKTASEINVAKKAKCKSLLDQSTEATPQTVSYRIKSYRNSSSKSTFTVFEEFDCLQCLHQTSSVFQLNHHIQREHKNIYATKLFHAIVEPEQFCCINCDYKSSYQFELYEHCKEAHNTRTQNNGRTSFCEEILRYPCVHCKFKSDSSLSFVKHSDLCEKVLPTDTVLQDSADEGRQMGGIARCESI